MEKDVSINKISEISNFIVPYHNKRDCYEDLRQFIYDANVGSRICALYGLLHTGKTVIMHQMAQELRDANMKVKYYYCKNNAEMYDLEKLLDQDLKDGVQCVFIDEITDLEDFQGACAVLADVYAAQGMKIVITGTNSLGISLSKGNQLLDRVKLIHTSYISFAEFHRLLGKGLEEYITYGGTLTDSPYKEQQEAKEYINSAIVENLVYSIEKSEGIRVYPPALTEIYSNANLISTINKMINNMSQYVAFKAVDRNYRNAVLNATGNAMKTVFAYKDYIDVDKVTAATKTALKIKDKSELDSPLSESGYNALKEYLKLIDLLLVIPVYDSLKEMRPAIAPIEIILQPGMVYTHATELIKELLKDESWIHECKIQDKHTFMNRAERNVKGIILENAIIANAFINYKSERNLYISKVHITTNGAEHEADMIFADYTKNESYLFEVKYADEYYANQLSHLLSDSFVDYVSKHFGEVKDKYVIYNGPSNMINGVHYINAEDYFKAIYMHKDNWRNALSQMNDISMAHSLHTPNESLDDKLNKCTTSLQADKKNSDKAKDRER